jgi:hypothetical protein
LVAGTAQRVIPNYRVPIAMQQYSAMMSSALRNFILFCLLVGAAAAQQAQSPGASQRQPSEQPQHAKTPAKQHTITPAEAAELFRSVEEITAFVSTATGLPQKRAIKRQIARRDTVEKLIRDRMTEDDNLERFQRSEAVLKKFGLIPRDFDLQDFLIRLMKEQAAGFYNFRDQTVYLLDWIDEEAQKPVLAHELMHALQDQKVDVENWLDGLPVGTTREQRRRMREQQAEQPDDAMAARQAVLEGQGMTVMLDYLLSPSGRTIVQEPAVVAMFEAGTMAESGKSPELSSAPVYLREWLVFPYTRGLRFVHHVLMQRGKAAAYPELLTNPPGSTLQVMYPELYLAGMKIPEVKLPDVTKLLAADWTHFDTGAMGAFDIAVMAEQFADDELGDELAPAWRGGRYVAFRPKLKLAAGGGDSTAGTLSSVLALMYVSRWKNEKSAARFAEAYAAWLPQRHAKATPLADDCKCKWATSDGLVSVERQGDTVLVLESFDEASAARLRAAIFPAEQP